MKHADILDTAQDNDQNARDRALAIIQAKVKPAIKSTVCLECTGETENGARWCCPSCRDEWSKWNPEA